MKEESHRIIGIDEVGRGALAGPVVVAAAAVSQSAQRGMRSVEKKIGKLKDSKKLSPRRRAAWLEYFKRHSSIVFVIARVYPHGIEKMNISKAANKAALKAFEKVLAITHVSFSASQVYLDGGLYLGNKKSRLRKGNFKKEIRNVKTVIKGDEKITAVKIASIAAKVSRDNYMCRLAKKYPEYGFDIHKGYGTKAHFGAIRKHGPSSVHRRSFLGSQMRKQKRA